jgi:hypothetical protein
MVKFELLRDRGILILSPDGPLEKADFERLSQEIDPFIASAGGLTGLMVCAKAFPGWDSVAALVSHLKFVRNHHRQVARVAIVTDSELLKIMPHIAKHLVSAQVQQFSSVKGPRPWPGWKPVHERGPNLFVAFTSAGNPHCMQ